MLILCCFYRVSVCSPAARVVMSCPPRPGVSCCLRSDAPSGSASPRRPRGWARRPCATAGAPPCEISSRYSSGGHGTPNTSILSTNVEANVYFCVESAPQLDVHLSRNVKTQTARAVIGQLGSITFPTSVLAVELQSRCRRHNAEV